MNLRESMMPSGWKKIMDLLPRKNKKERAVFGMLPHNRLGRAMGKKLFVYAGSEHPHAAQKPVMVEVK